MYVAHLPNVEHSSPSLQNEPAVPRQQASPMRPHAAQSPDEHTAPDLHVWFAKHARPMSPWPPVDVH